MTLKRMDSVLIVREPDGALRMVLPTIRLPGVIVRGRKARPSIAPTPVRS
jgi:hypothetical protein